MSAIKEYYPSLLVSEYKLGEYYMFIRNTTYMDKKLPEKYKKIGAKKMVGGLEPDEDTTIKNKKGGLAPEDMKVGKKGGLAPDDIESEVKKGGLAPDDEISFENIANFSEYNKKKKTYGIYSIEIGRIIGINEVDEKLYVQFADTKENYCHIFKTGISSDGFDELDKRIRMNGR